MSRLIDRARVNGIHSWKFDDWPKREADPLERELPANAEFPQAISCMSVKDLEDVEIFVADDVLAYLDQFAESVRSFDIITQVVPPFPRMFIEFRSVGTYRQRHGLYAWGVLVESTDFTEAGDLLEGARWGLKFQVLFEPRKGYISGPVAESRMFARPDGTLDRFSPEGKAIGGHTWMHCIPQWFEPERPDTFTQEIEGALWELLVPALFTISLLHSRNVVAEEVRPEARLNRSSLRRHGIPMATFKVLRLEPFKRMLAIEGDAQSQGLEHAIHVCRGHFKRYSEDAPLFGKFTGQWWWSAHRRGDPSLGSIIKDYEVRLPGFGAVYRSANEYPALEGASEARVKDPDTAGRGLRAHNVTQNTFATILEELNFEPRSPNSSEDEYDIGWRDGEAVWVGEVKSLTPANEERQLRMALSQLIRYRQSLREVHANVHAVVICESPPLDMSWHRTFRENAIAVTYPENFREFLEQLRP